MALDTVARSFLWAFLTLLGLSFICGQTFAFQGYVLGALAIAAAVLGLVAHVVGLRRLKKNCMRAAQESKHVQKHGGKR